MGLEAIDDRLVPHHDPEDVRRLLVPDEEPTVVRTGHDQLAVPIISPGKDW